MATQSEAELENNFIKQLVSLGYESVDIHDEEALINNLRSQLEKHNKTTFTDAEFKQIMEHLRKGTVFEKAMKLRDKFNLNRKKRQQENPVFRAGTVE